MYKVAICDDDKKYLTVIEEILMKQKNCPQEIQFFRYISGEELINELYIDFDLIFLDIQMRGIDGNKTAEIIRNKNLQSILVFCTGTQMPTPDSFKVQPFRYIIKRIDNKNLIDEMPAIIDKMTHNIQKKYIDVYFDGEFTRILIDEIIFIALQKYGSKIFVSERLQKNGIGPEIKTRMHIKDIYQELILMESNFEFIHYSFVVNLNYILKVEKMNVLLKNGTKLNISRSKKTEFDKKFTQYLKENFRRRKLDE